MSCATFIETWLFSVKYLSESVFQDDDSDLEYELEAFPAVSAEASTEAAACVKVLFVAIYAPIYLHHSCNRNPSS